MRKQERNVELEKYDLFRVTLDRTSLNALMGCLSKDGPVEVTVDQHGEIIFDIPAGEKIDIKRINIIEMLVEQTIQVRQKQYQYEDESNEYAELEMQKGIISSAIDVVSGLLEKLNKKE